MKQLLLDRNINKNINKNRRKTVSRLTTYKLNFMLIAFVLLIGCTTDLVKAASGLKIYDYTTKKTSYTGNPLTVTCNGSVIGNAKYPGILVDGIALLPYYDIFAASSVGAECVYNKENGSISISKYGNRIDMKLGSKSAKVNGKAYTLPAAPRLVKYTKNNVIKLFVPSRFVSEKLGLGYTWNKDKNTIAIKMNTLQLAYNEGKKFEYTGVQGNVILNGKRINLNSAPSIIINNTAMLSAYKVFANSLINADYTYNKTSKTVTLSKGGNTLVMTIGSKKAYLNNKEMMLSAAPVYVTNYNSNSSYVLVPGSFTASCLGYDYKWNSSTKTSSITSRKGSSGGNSSNNDPELGDSGDISETGTILNQWSAPVDQYSMNSGITDINALEDAANPGMINSIMRDYTNTKKNSETFMIQVDSAFHKVSSSKTGKIITIQADAVNCIDEVYSLYGSSSNLVNIISTNNQSAMVSSKIVIEVLQDSYQYDITLSEDKKILYVTVYNNALISAFTGTNDRGDYLVLNGLYPLSAKVSETPGLIYIDLPYVVNCLDSLNSEIQGSKYIKQIITSATQDKTQIILSVKDGYEYYKQESGNKFVIALQPKEGQDQPDLPDAVDMSKYEIIIPKPAGINSSMISDEDFYYNNYFVLNLEGDYTNELTPVSIQNNSSTVSNISVTLNNSNNTVIKFTTTRLQGYEITSDEKNIYINVGNPREIYKNIVILDPGHGGPATGTSRNGNYEKNINLKILYSVGKNYFNQDTSKLKVYYTRTSDVDMTLRDRAAYASKMGADLFVSLHMNSAVNAPNAKGTEVFYSHNNNSANKAGLKSEKLASYLVRNLSDALGSNNRGVKENIFTVIDSNTVPAVLIELGFLSNSSDYTMVMDQEKQEIAAQTIYDTLLQVFEDYPTGR